MGSIHSCCRSAKQPLRANFVCVLGLTRPSSSTQASLSSLSPSAPRLSLPPLPNPITAPRPQTFLHLCSLPPTSMFATPPRGSGGTRCRQVNDDPLVPLSLGEGLQTWEIGGFRASVHYFPWGSSLRLQSLEVSMQSSTTSACPLPSAAQEMQQSFDAPALRPSCW